MATDRAEGTESAVLYNGPVGDARLRLGLAPKGEEERSPRWLVRLVRRAVIPFCAAGATSDSTRRQRFRHRSPAGDLCGRSSTEFHPHREATARRTCRNSAPRKEPVPVQVTRLTQNLITGQDNYVRLELKGYGSGSPRRTVLTIEVTRR